MPPERHRKKKASAKPKPGPVRSSDDIPYDYIVVIDAGSHGSRAYVYNWLNPQHALEAGIDITQARKVNLVRKIFGEDSERSLPLSDADTDSDTDSELEDNTAGSKPLKFPFVRSKKKWHRAIKPGLSSFNESPQKVGKHHMSYLLNLASSVVPKSEHHRTPIFLHATAGMRLLPPNEQEPILANICQYLMSNSDFFIPDCNSHVNIINGNIEGLYGWISINYLVGSFDRPEEHQQGKNHTTYGLLDMGGASTQVVFQPNLTEIEEHKNNLYKVSLYTVPPLTNNSEENLERAMQYQAPRIVESSVYSDSFLGFGMFQAHNRYLKLLLDDYRKANDFPETTYRFRTPISDPCLPKGYTFTGLVDEHYVEFTGKSEFQECLNSIFPVLANNTYTLGKSSYSGDCQKLGEENKVSSCLLNEMIPSFDFEINHFIGVSGYWDIVNSLLASLNMPNIDSPTSKYDYSLIYEKTRQICSSPLNALLDLNSMRDEKSKLQEEDLAELCFKASWVLNFLHVGLGFPRFGIDDIENKDEKFKSLELIDKFAGSSFSWTLGRAVLYANDEYIQAYNNYTRVRDPLLTPVKRSGYVFTAAEGSFIYGAEQEPILPRPSYTMAELDATYPHFDYESKYTDDKELKWNIKPHRYTGMAILVLLLFVVFYFLSGKSGRSILIEKVSNKAQAVKKKALKCMGLGPRYAQLETTDRIEMSLVSTDRHSDECDVFRIDEEAD